MVVHLYVPWLWPQLILHSCTLERDSRSNSASAPIEDEFDCRRRGIDLLGETDALDTTLLEALEQLN